MSYCRECGMNLVESHHIVFRSQAPYMINIKINQICLCVEHHKGGNGPHRNKEKNLEYKFELQKKLFQLFNKDYYTEKEIKDLLETNIKIARKITKKLKVYQEGYERAEIVYRLMGERFYGEQN